MSIATAIENAQTKVENAYIAVSNKGGTLPATQDLSHLPAAIGSIAGSIPSGSMYFGGITTLPANALYQKYMNINTITNVYFPDLTILNKNRVLTQTFYQCTGIVNVEFNSLTSISFDASSEGVCESTFEDCTSIENVSFPVLTTINGTYCCRQMFSGGSSISSIDLHLLSSIQGTNACDSMFYGCACESLNLSALSSIEGDYACNGMFADSLSLKTVNLSALTTITSGDEDGRTCVEMFSGCPLLENVDISSLRTITDTGTYDAFLCGAMFKDDVKLKSVSFSSLQDIDCPICFVSAFDNCTELTDLYFPALSSGSIIDQSVFGFSSSPGAMLSGCDGVTIHFPKNLDPNAGSTVISSLYKYPAFGGTNTVLAFDLPSTFTLTGNNTKQYERNPKYDTSSALAWFDNSSVMTTPYYTSGTADPILNATIYSDSACTIPVTTITSIVA